MPGRQYLLNRHRQEQRPRSASLWQSLDGPHHNKRSSTYKGPTRHPIKRRNAGFVIGQSREKKCSTFPLGACGRLPVALWRPQQFKNILTGKAREELSLDIRDTWISQFITVMLPTSGIMQRHAILYLVDKDADSQLDEIARQFLAQVPETNQFLFNLQCVG